MPTSDEQELRSRAKFIFQGTVQKIGAATLANIQADEKTAVVTVDAIVQGPPALQAYAGQPITVQLAPKEKVQPGEQATFYAKPWIFGDGLAVSSIGHTPIAVTATVAAATNRPLERLLRSGVDERIATAEAVVTGRVVSVHLPEEESTSVPRATGVRTAALAGPAAPAKPERISEHDPIWRDAVIEVKDVQKGEVGGRQVIVRFPSSEDVRWHRAPKFHPGQEGVFILHKSEGGPPASEGAVRAASTRAAAAGRGAAAEPEHYTTLHPADFQPADQAVSIDLLARAQVGEQPAETGPPHAAGTRTPKARVTTKKRATKAATATARATTKKRAAKAAGPKRRK